MKLTSDTQIAHLDGIWISTSQALRDYNTRTLQDLTMVSIAPYFLPLLCILRAELFVATVRIQEGLTVVSGFDLGKVGSH